MIYLRDLVLLLILYEHPLVHGRFLAVPPVNLVPSYRACSEIERLWETIFQWWKYASKTFILSIDNNIVGYVVELLATR